ncbi:hypothetical protein [Bradyrhizobium sp. McL0616]|uniref:hypothetical protein n=1 Tax=Bradyrhizobium sp. McL0616 TaxID=3415674 RepID=UPI003CFA92C0
MQKRRRFKQVTSLRKRLEEFAADCRKAAGQMPAGLNQDAMLRRGRQADTAAHLDDWLSSPGLKTPT